MYYLWVRLGTQSGWKLCQGVFPLCCKLWRLFHIKFHTRIYGRIPTQISKLGQIVSINVSYSSLCGPVSTAGVLEELWSWRTLMHPRLSITSASVGDRWSRALIIRTNKAKKYACVLYNQLGICMTWSVIKFCNSFANNQGNFWSKIYPRCFSCQFTSTVYS